MAFGHFDILTDEEVRQGLKTFSNWPTYPQLYGDGALIGGLDIVKEMKEDGESRPPPAAATAEPLDARLSWTAQSPVMLFMKGSPDAPRCGFSRQRSSTARASPSASTTSSATRRCARA